MKKNNCLLNTIDCRLLCYCLLFTVYCLLIACGGGLTDEQRKKIKKEMETSQIKRVSEAEITEAAYAKGRELVILLSAKQNSDSVAKSNAVKISWLEPGKTDNREIENQLIEAYINNLNGAGTDNVQRVGSDSLLYTLPVIEKQADSSDVVKGVWSIYFSRKQIVLDL
jgi:hypothetical protein